jgi:oxepin-CoA hydrolase / 3-oxo-5,6-dehydrosuberyl-CoA semialdehyde dehydrogenase
MQLSSYVYGTWHSAKGGIEVPDAVYGQPVAIVSSEGLDFAAASDYARRVAGPALRALSFHERARRLKALASYLLARKAEFYALSSKTGATKRDSWVDIDGGIGTLFSYSSMARRHLPAGQVWLEGEVEKLSRNGSFLGRHILLPREGVAVHINAFNFPVWGMLEKLAPNLIAGMPAIVKPATPTAYVTAAVVRAIIESGILPEGSVQLICGATGDLFSHLIEDDVVTFTGSASTAYKLKSDSNIIKRSIPFNTEADSLNCCILGESVEPDSPEFGLFINEVINEMTTKSGQRCTAIRRIIVPRAKSEAVLLALRQRLAQVQLGDPLRLDQLQREQPQALVMGPLVGASQRDGVQTVIEQLQVGIETVFARQEQQLVGGDWQRGGFLAPTLLFAERPLAATAPHELEAFGPVATVMAYDGLAEAIALAKRGRGSLVGSIVSFDRHEARDLCYGLAAQHGRILILNRENAAESTGHGSPLPQLLHGGPGRAGGGAELGGLRGIAHYMQRSAVQADPTTLAFLSGQHVTGAAVTSSEIHPFRKYFEQLSIGEQLITHRRTVTEADIVHFAALSGDHFYAHTDEIAAKQSLFEKRVAHGYFLVSAAAGLFVHPAVGPVLANYGLENLRFIEPVGIGDTIHASLTVKQKTERERKPEDRFLTGVVEWAVEILNQHQQVVALYSILTLVERRENTTERRE